MAIRWAQEACDRFDDAESGSRVIQLTSSAAASNNVYCEQPYTSPDGKRVAILRKHDNFDPTMMLLVGELDTLRVGLITRDIIGTPATTPWSGQLYYWTSERYLQRTSLQTLETETILHEEDPTAALGAWSVSPDNRYLIFGSLASGAIACVTRLDLQTRERVNILEDPEIVNPHPKFEPIYGKRISILHNRGAKRNRNGEVVQSVGPQGATLFQIDIDGGNRTPLPIGPPYTESCTGHSAFIPGTHRIIFTTCWDHETHGCDPRYPQGNIFTVEPGDGGPTNYPCPEHRSNHVSMSRCGKYFVADSYLGPLFDEQRTIRPVALIIGNLQSGKYRILVKNTLASGGANQWSHTHPYLTANNRHVIFNTDNFYGIPQVYAATVPEEFLVSLD